MEAILIGLVIVGVLLMASGFMLGRKRKVTAETLHPADLGQDGVNFPEPGAGVHQADAADTSRMGAVEADARK